MNPIMTDQDDQLLKRIAETLTGELSVSEMSADEVVHLAIVLVNGFVSVTLETATGKPRSTKLTNMGKSYLLRKFGPFPGSYKLARGIWALGPYVEPEPEPNLSQRVYRAFFARHEEPLTAQVLNEMLLWLSQEGDPLVEVHELRLEQLIKLALKGLEKENSK